MLKKRVFSKAAWLLAGLQFATLAAPPAFPVAPGAAFAQPAPGNDVIDLKGGGILRGTIIEAVPDADVRILLATGEIATVPWVDVGQIERGAPAAAGPVAQRPPRAPAPQPPPRVAATLPDTAKIWVHIEGSEGARLEQDRRATKADDHQWEVMCTAPCDMALPKGYAYRIGGEGLRASGEFTLSGDNGDRETLDVSEASSSGFSLGIVGVALGGASIGVGLIVMMYGWAQNLSMDQGQAHAGDGTEMSGLAVTLAGLAGVLGGVALIVTNARTHVTQVRAASGEPLPGSAPVAGGLETSTRRQLFSIDDARAGEKSSAAIALPAAMTVPVFGARF